MGRTQEFSEIGAHIELSYLRFISEKFDAGLTTGYLNFFGKSINNTSGTITMNDFGYFPSAASVKFYAFEDVKFTTDLGYAIGINPSVFTGGFYYAAKIQFDFEPISDVVLGYKRIRLDNGSIEALTLGIEIKL